MSIFDQIGHAFEKAADTVVHVAEDAVHEVAHASPEEIAKTVIETALPEVPKVVVEGLVDAVSDAVN